MASLIKIKIGLIGIFSLLMLGWSMSSASSVAHGVLTEPAEHYQLAVNANPDDYVGSEACQTCHEDQFKNFSGTKHAKLKDVSSWKNKPQGCESCHGPGKAHVEDATVPNKIISFKNQTAKQVSETCLGCHSGKESHNNFRRGEHWRNDVTCTDCHSPHGSPRPDTTAGSGTFVADATKPSHAIPAMLKANEPNLCISCHNETKSQFSKPFHHKVLEGTMKCSDCHNAHGGFEAKQTKLSIGADASCIKCHSDKQGPFAFEHAPLKTEGCAACHTPHGSSNPKLLRRASVRQLCMECHTTLSDAEPGAPQAPHDQRTARYNNCTTCHARIHGSNSHKFFFR